MGQTTLTNGFACCVKWVAFKAQCRGSAVFFFAFSMFGRPQRTYNLFLMLRVSWKLAWSAFINDQTQVIVLGLLLTFAVMITLSGAISACSCFELTGTGTLIVYSLITTKQRAGHTGERSDVFSSNIFLKRLHRAKKSLITWSEAQLQKQSRYFMPTQCVNMQLRFRKFEVTYV